MSIIDYLQIPVFQRAFIAALLAGGALSLLGTVIVVQNLTTIRFALMHVALLGGAVGLILGSSPLTGATVAIVLGSCLLGPVSQRLRLEPGLIGAFFMTGSMAIAFLLFYRAGVPAMDVFGLFAGSILTLTSLDLWVMGVLGFVVVAVFAVLFREIQLVFYDREQAEWLGMPAKKIENVLLFLAGMSIGVAMKIVGALLIDAIILLPALTAIRLARTFLQLLIYTSVVGMMTTLGGLLLSMVIDLPTGATIATVGACLLGCSWLFRR